MWRIRGQCCWGHFKKGGGVRQKPKYHCRQSPLWVLSRCNVYVQRACLFNLSSARDETVHPQIFNFPSSLIIVILTSSKAATVFVFFANFHWPMSQVVPNSSVLRFFFPLSLFKLWRLFQTSSGICISFVSNDQMGWQMPACESLPRAPHHQRVVFRDAGGRAQPRMR